jgi:hypothetical protein
MGWRHSQTKKKWDRLRIGRAQARQIRAFSKLHCTKNQRLNAPNSCGETGASNKLAVKRNRRGRDHETDQAGRVRARGVDPRDLAQVGEEEESGEGEEQAGAARDRRAQVPPEAGVEEGRRRTAGVRHGRERASEGGFRRDWSGPVVANHRVAGFVTSYWANELGLVYFNFFFVFTWA